VTADSPNFVVIDRPRAHCAVVTLNRPERMNSMAFEVMVPLREALAGLGADNDIRSIIITGAGRGFCSGADQSGEKGRMPNTAGLTAVSVALRAMTLLEEIVSTLRTIPQPVIAAVNGAAIGGGLCLAMACDIRVASDQAYFRAAGINNGLTASELGLSYLLPRAIGITRASELMLTGRDVDAAEAERIGIVSQVVDGPTLLDTCVAIADQIAGWSRPGIELTKRTLRSSMEATSLEGHMQAEGLGQLFVRLMTGNFEEAVAARKEGRRPSFKD
jgi:enoyl-CoA hydratase